MRIRTLRLPQAAGCVVLIAILLAVLPFSLRTASVAGAGSAQTGSVRASRTGNAIFIHPDGTGAAHWNAARAYWQGPDGMLEWDRLPEIALYRGHMSDRLTASSNGGATAHAFGYKVVGPLSFGQDGGGENARPILARSGYPGSVLREAAAAGYPVGLVNDGDVAEPGSAVFAAEVADRSDAAEVVRQLLEGRPGFEGEPAPAVVLGGGERFFVPAGTPRCAAPITLDCAVHADPVDGSGPARTDGRNLLREAAAAGWSVIRTRAEFEALRTALQTDPGYAPRVLGLFAADDLFNDVPEEALLARELVNPAAPDADRSGRLLLWGDRPGTPGFDPPTAAEMAELALLILERRSAAAGHPFLLVVEVESTDNFAGANNAIGLLRALRAADEVIGVARAFQARVPDTLVLTAADSEAGGPQIVSPPPTDDEGGPEAMAVNPTGRDDENLAVPLDGIEGRSSAPFAAAPDAAGRSFEFVVAWAGTDDFPGGVVARAQGKNARLLRTHFAAGIDNTDIYRLLYLTLFGKLLPASTGLAAPARAP